MNTPAQKISIVMDDRSKKLFTSDTREITHRGAAFMRDLSERHARCEFDNYEPPKGDGKTVFSGVKYLAGEIDQFVKEGRNMILFGTPGTGKDHLAVSLVKVAIRVLGVSARSVNGMDFYSKAREAITKKEPENTLLRQYDSCTILIISDPIPDRRGLSGYNLELMYLLANRRWERCLPTIVTCNCRTLAEMKKKLGGPLYNRLEDGAHIFKMSWESRRKPRQTFEGGK